MNWLLEGTSYYSALSLRGMELVHPERWRVLSDDENSAALVKRRPTLDRVAVLISGGGANGPLFPGYVADGLADGAVVGAPYAAPNAYAIYEAGRYLGREKGVLLLYNNFAGDYLNNDMAQELLEMDGIAVESAVSTGPAGTVREEAFTLPAGGDLLLEVRLEIGETGEITVLTWKTVYAGDWDVDDTITLWDGD